MDKNSFPSPDEKSTLFFAPLAWLKLQWFCHAGNTEIGGFGISAEHNPLYVEDFVTVRQRVSSVSVQFEDAAVADYFDACVDHRLPVERFARIWVHTHPGSSPLPSSVDEETFAGSFGNCAWAVMFIVGRTGLTYARLAFSAGPGGQVLLPVAVHWADLPRMLSQAGALDAAVTQWRQEYDAHIHRIPLRVEVPYDNLATAPGPWWEHAPWSEEMDGVYYEPLTQGDGHDPIAG